MKLEWAIIMCCIEIFIYILKATLRSTIVWIVVDAMCVCVWVYAVLSRRLFSSSFEWIVEMVRGVRREVMTTIQMKMKPKPGGKTYREVLYSQHTACVCVFCVFTCFFFFVGSNSDHVEFLINLMPVFFCFLSLQSLHHFFYMYNKFIFALTFACDRMHQTAPFAFNLFTFSITFHCNIHISTTTISSIISSNIYTLFYIFFC